MNKKILNRYIAILTLGITSLIAPSTNLTADEVATTTDECTKDFLLSYFPEPVVIETLKKFNIPEEKQKNIASALTKKDKEITKLVEKKAETMTPNPLKDPQQRQFAVKLFRDTLFEVFSDVLAENGITDKTKIQPMLDDIQQQKAKKFAMCMEKNRRQNTQSK